MKENKYSNIADKALAIVEKKETERLNTIKKNFLDSIKKKLSEMKCTTEKWQLGETKRIVLEKSSFAKEDVIAVASCLGFEVQVMDESSAYEIVYELSVPKRMKNQKKTAKEMICRHNLEVDEFIRMEEESAEKECEKVFEEIDGGTVKLVYVPQKRGYQFEVNMYQKTPNAIFRAKVEKIMQEHGFCEISFSNTGTLIFEVKKK